MFFNMETGETISKSAGNDVICWIADGNLWIDCGAISTCVNKVSLDKLCLLIDKSLTTKEYIDDVYNKWRSNKYIVALEHEDEGFRNLCFWNDGLFISIKMKIEHLISLKIYLKR